MKTVLTWLALATALVCSATEAMAQAGPFEPPPARRASQAGGALTPPSNASPVAIVATYLRGQGRDVALLRSIVEVTRSTRQGITQARLEQRAAGLPVYGTYAKAAFSAQGELLHLVENFVAVRPVARARVSARQAIDAAVRGLYPDLRQVPPGFFREPPSATAVAIPHENGTMSAGFLIETWTDERNRLHETLVDGDGSILDVESRTANDSYNVFRINPNATPQQLLFGPGSGNEQSPIGWLFAGAQGSTDIRGNNIAAYLDAVSDNESDGTGTTITTGDFTAVADLAVSPSQQVNRDVAVQNLFYLNNLIHDVLFSHGFVEATGNFQEDNFGHGGRGSDSVDAEAQDGGGIDNANFATPRDGRNPRMQMYLWSGLGTHQVVAGGETFLAQGAVFGPELDATGISGIIALVNDGTGTTSDGCEALAPGSFNGMVALADRGTCNFTVKVKNAQNAGAVAVIIANNSGGDFIATLGGEDATVTIPAVMISQNSGVTLKAMVPVAGTVRLSPTPPLELDGDVDADIVFHEYCHGLTWRMIGRMDGALAGAIGEGMSDTCAMLLNGDDAIGEYSSSSPTGIRRFRYDAYPNTYSDVTGASVHDDGEIYGAIMWRLMELFGEARRSVLFGYLVDGMNYTPEAPSYEAMRDGILASVASAPDDAGDTCRVWQAFAQFGVGVGATGKARGPRVVISESFTVPAVCTAP